MGLTVPAESHILGWGALNTRVPSGAFAWKLSWPSSERLTPFVRLVILSRESAGSAAAAAVFTTSTCVKPPRSFAVSVRSTSGRTPGYVIPEPEAVGAGRGAGQDRASSAFPFLIVTSGPDPPPEKSMSPGTARGAYVPSFCRASVLSTGTQAPLLRTRCGVTAVVQLTVPPGLAVAVSVSVVRASTCTGSPVRSASRCAVPSARSCAASSPESASSRM